MDPSLAIAYPSYDLASRPAGEVVGTREAISWTFDVFDRPVETVLPGGVGRTAGAFQGFTRSFDTLDRLSATGGLGAAGLSSTPLGADWSWGGASRLYAMTTRGALGTGVRYGYHGGAGPQVPGGAPTDASEWKLGRMSWGAAAGVGATEAPTVSWGDFGFGWRGYEGAPSDGAKIGREVFGGVGSRNVLAGMGWSWSYDAGVRLSEAVPGVGSLSGAAPAAGETADRFTFTYGAGDELLERLRQATGEVDRFTTGDYGRISSRDGVAFSYDGVGRRLEDDRFVYRWDWRGQLVEVTVRETWPDGEVSPYAGHRLSYDYDAGGRLHRRLHEGIDAGDGTRPFIEERRYVWESDRMAVEAGYGADGGLRWRHTYVPGPSGLDDAPQVVVEIFQPGSPLSGEARTYTYLTDELGTIVGLVAEDEGSDPANPPVPVRYRYTPYGEAHVETGPELLRARFDGDVTAVETGSGTVEQTVADESVAAPGGLTLRWSVPLDGASLGSGVIVERLVAGSGWQAVPAAVGGRAADGVSTSDDGTELRVVLADGWERGASYRVRLAPELSDELGRPFGQSETLQWSVPAAATESVRYERRWATEYETFEAARASVGGRMPGGQGRLFQGLWTDPVTGVSFARARWYDARNAGWLSEDPVGTVDSQNLYAFVGHSPTMYVDPMGRQQAQPAIVETLVKAAANDNHLVRPTLYLIEAGAASSLGAGGTLSAGTAVAAAPAWAVGGVVVVGGTGGWLLGRGIGHIPTGNGTTVDDRVRGMWQPLVDHFVLGEDYVEVSPQALRSGQRTDEEWAPVHDLSGNVVRYIPQPRSPNRLALMRHPFSSGGTHITTTAALDQYPGSATYGGPDGLYLAPSGQIDDLLARAESRRDLEIALGLEENALSQGELVRIDVADPLARNLRSPDPTTGNLHHRPGTGLTTGGLNEAVVDSPQKGDSGVGAKILPEPGR